MTDLTDRYNEICGELEGESLLDEWAANPTPGKREIDSRVILEEVSGQVWLWNTRESGETIEYSGELMEIAE